MDDEIDLVKTLPIFFTARDEYRYKFCEAYRLWVKAEHELMSYDETEELWRDYVKARDTWLNC